MPTQSEYNVTKSRTRKFYVKFDLLNYKLQTVGNLDGVIIGTPSFSIDATSDIRRTCSLSIEQIDSSFDIKQGNKIWLDKFVKIYIGLEEISTGIVQYTNMGVYMINNPSRAYSAVTNTLTIDGLDLMAKLTGLRNGNLQYIPYIIPQGSNIRNSIISTLTLGGFTNYVVDECMGGSLGVPNELRFDTETTVYDILVALRDIYPQYQIYFDTDGVFHYNLIPSGNNEQVMINNDIFNETIIEYNIDTDFEHVKNYIEVYGKTHDVNIYAEYMNLVNKTIEIHGSELFEGAKVGFTLIPISSDIHYISYWDTTYVPWTNTIYQLGNIYSEVPIIENTKPYGENYYVIRFNNGYFTFLGEITPSAMIQETNPDSPFYVNSELGIIRKVFTGGEYDNIYCNDLAMERARWELYNYCRIQDNITITCAPIYWADVNWLIEVTLPNKQGTEETNQYIIKQINTSLGVSETQTITAMRYYPFYAE